MTIIEGYRPGRHVISAHHVHLLLITKYRRGVLDEDMLACCHDAMRKACDDFGAELHAKGLSTRRLQLVFTDRVNRHIMHGRCWSPPYFAAYTVALR